MQQISPFTFSKKTFSGKGFLLFCALFIFSNNTFAQYLTAGGTIGSDQVVCPGAVPAPITNVTLPSGGDTNLPIEYMWMSSTTGGPVGGSSYTAIPNSNSPDFSPGAVGLTTIFVRCSRRVGSGNPNFAAESNPVVITVQQAPTAIINGNPGVGFRGITVTLTAAYAGPNASFRWDLDGDGIIDAFGQTITHTFNAAGTFDILLSVFNGYCEGMIESPIFINSAYEANAFDSCDCDNPLNIADNLGNAYYNSDFVFITSNPGETWTITSIAPIGGGIVDQSLNPIPVGTVIPEASPGRYIMNLWFDGLIGGWEIEVTNNNGFSVTTGPGNIASCGICPNSPLPVELNNFEATAQGSKVMLTWETGAELENSHFQIEKSWDGIRFDPLGVVPGNGTTNETSFYNFEDDKALVGKTYYRLKQVDYDGDSEYSGIVSVEIEGDGSNISVAPNPMEKTAIVRFEEYLIGGATLNLTTTDGKILKQYEIEASIRAVEINVEDLPEGIYFLNVTSQSQRQNSFYKIIKF